ncbi:hypothetical protein BDA96_01G305300 [Sorghum bicolor]|uniref:Uncharacterized protein n=2 Tax=Sorghum bicolor TaxID=4558 RepID=A0A921PXA8_SORBI|nr:hypothetical protein BDA96_K000200 [Sorghum bicolor]KAG0529788.1 hypothetical protein BDA96_05G127200 [Sorghum bicolor]KAG0549681.1 hypothetical protein BDA96_01G276100 [Sorghum bicolor]KAG0549742.1 hypothetical protein BDA96_01G280700 [Sorghum bicolor]KAG0550038.1 hypothetical protein BDA96_01G305300 [Sorghum bicolor]
MYQRGIPAPQKFCRFFVRFSTAFLKRPQNPRNMQIPCGFCPKTQVRSRDCRPGFGFRQ